MRRILTRPVTWVVTSLALLACAGPAIATGRATTGRATAGAKTKTKTTATSKPPAAFVRIEGASSTLLPQTLVQTTSARKLRDQVCSGSSAATALTIAAHGAWMGTWFKSFSDFEVNAILGETPAGLSDFWTLWVNGRESQTGACGTKLHSGDHELWFDCLGDANGNCSNDPLAVSAPAAVRRGHKVTVRVTQLDPSGHGAPVPGAAISGSGVAAVSDADGRATFVPWVGGEIGLRASKSGATPSDTKLLCVYAQRRSQCGAIGRSGPPTRILGIRNGEVFKGHGPRLLHGTAGPDPLGITDVRLTLRRQSPTGACTYYDSGTGTWHGRGCNVAPAGAPFSVGANASWSYLLPRALPPGGYRLVAVATDAGGNETRVVVGRTAVLFTVRP